jgi:hypothetical protein
MARAQNFQFGCNILFFPRLTLKMLAKKANFARFLSIPFLKSNFSPK